MPRISSPMRTAIMSCSTRSPARIPASKRPATMSVNAASTEISKSFGVAVDIPLGGLDGAMAG